MRLLHVVQELRPGGAERVVIALSRGAEAAGHVVAVAAAPGALEDELAAPRYELPLLNRRAWRLPAAGARLNGAVRRFDPDLLHVHNPGMAAVAALVSLRGRRMPALVTAHGVPDEDYSAASRVLRLARLPVVACGPGVADALESNGLTVRATIVNGVGSPPRAADRADLDRQWAIVPGTTLVVAVGRLVGQKRHELAIRAIAELPAAVLVIVGEGPREHVLRDLAESLGLADRVVITGARADARSILGAADVAVLPSRWEGLPLVALEALAAGTPLVATDVRGTRELLTDGVDAVLVPADDASALAGALARVAKDQALRRTLVANGLRTAALYSDDAMVAAYLDLYDELLSR